MKVGAMDLHDAVDGLMAHDHGALDSGIADAVLRSEARAALIAMTEEEFGRFAREHEDRYYLNREAFAAGYREDDADAFREWVRGFRGGTMA